MEYTVNKSLLKFKDIFNYFFNFSFIVLLFIKINNIIINIIKNLFNKNTFIKKMYQGS